MLDASVDKVVVRTFAGSGHYGRSNGGNAGAEDEAVILSQAVGKPVRVQWMRNDDLQWSTQSSAAFSDVEIALDSSGKLSAFQIDHFMPAMQDDRLVGAILAGLPTIPAPNEKGSLFGMRVNPADPWLYDGTPNILERAHGGPQIGQASSPINVGLRDHSLRTPTQYQQNFPREVAITEAACSRVSIRSSFACNTRRSLVSSPSSNRCATPPVGIRAKGFPLPVAPSSAVKVCPLCSAARRIGRASPTLPSIPAPA